MTAPMVPEARWSGRTDLELAFLHALLMGASDNGFELRLIADPDLRQVAGTLLRIRRGDGPVDAVVLADALRQEGSSARGKDWRVLISRILDAPAVKAHAGEYARRLDGYEGAARLSESLRAVLNEIESPGGQQDPEATLETARADLREALDDIPSWRQLNPASPDDVLSAARSAVTYTLEPIFTERGVRIVSGMGKSYKTTTSIGLLLSTISETRAGQAFAGHFWSPGGHTIALVDAENRLEVWARKFVPIARGLNLDAEDLLTRGRFLCYPQRRLWLDDPATLDAVIDELKRRNVTELIIDSLTRVHRLKEIDSGEMNRFFVESIFRLRDEVGCGITILHHHRKAIGSDDPAQALRGSSDLRNVVDTHLTLSREAKDRDVVRMDVTASREGPEGGPYYFRVVWNEDGRITFERVERGDVALRKVEAAQADILAALEQTGGSATRQTLLSVLRSKGHKERTITQALSALTGGPTPRLTKNREGKETTYLVTQS